MSEGPLVTIGISTYNRADSYLAQALDSALAQTWPNLEVIVSDNCSSDHTPQMVSERACERLRYIRHERNIGPNNNFNYCLDQARGEYFLLLHDDDQIDADFVESCMTAAAGVGEVGVIRTGTRVVAGNGAVVAEVPNTGAGLSPAELFLYWFERKTSFYLCSTLYHTKRLQESGGFHSRNNLFQDVTAIARLAVPYGRVDVPEVKASFRRHENNKGSSDAALDWADDSVYLLDLLAELMPEHAQRLRSRGERYLCQKCFRNVANIRSFRERWRAYTEIKARFGGACSPVAYLARRSRKRLRRAAGRLLRGSRQQLSGEPG